MQSLAYVVLIALLLAFGLPCSDHAHARTLQVGGKSKTSFKTITQAVRKARSGDVIAIGAGLYRGGFDIRKSLSLRFDSRAKIRLSAGQSIRLIGVKNIVLSNLNIGLVGKLNKKQKSLPPLLLITGSKNIKINDCRIFSGIAVAIYINKSSDVSIENCRISGHSSATGLVVSADRVFIAKTVITGVNMGLYVRSGKGIVIAENLFDANNTSIRIGSSKTDIVSNTISGPGKIGIWLLGGNSAVAGNSIRRYKYGIAALAPAQAIISGNRIGQNSSYGLYIGGPNFVISRNTVSYNHRQGIYWGKPVKAGPRLTTSEIRQNVITGNGVSGISIVDGDSVSVSQNLLENNHFGLSVTNSSVEIFNNTVVMSKGIGIYLYGQAKVQLRQNIIADNAKGISKTADVVLNSAKNIVYGNMIRQGFKLYDTNYVKQDWLPVSQGQELLVKIMPAYDLKAKDSQNINPGFVKLGHDYRLRSDSAVLGHFPRGSVPGAFPALSSKK